LPESAIHVILSMLWIDRPKLAHCALTTRCVGETPMVGCSSIWHQSVGKAVRSVGSCLPIVILGLAGATLIISGAFGLPPREVVLDATSNKMTDRMVKDGIQSTCAAVKPYPGDLGSTAKYRYDDFELSFTYQGPYGCVTFKLIEGGTCGDFSLYSPTFNPANRAANFLGDPGNSGNGREMSVILNNGQQITVVVNDRIGNATADCRMTLARVIGPAAHDFDSSGTSDIAWRQNGTGAVALWAMNGATVAGTASLGTVPANWSIVGQGDFNADGRDDLLWRDAASGTVAIWFLDAPTVKSTAIVASVSNNWAIVGVHDFNGDSKADLLWRDTNGNLAVWYMDGAQVLGAGFLAQVPTEWSVAGVADFDGDGRGDILWRNTNTGAVAIWFYEGAFAGSLVATVPTSWSIVATGHFAASASAHIVWRDPSGNIAIWGMDGALINTTRMLGTVPTNWVLIGTGDFNADGFADLLWRDTNTGTVAIWFMRFETVSSTAVIGTVPTDWVIQNVNAN